MGEKKQNMRKQFCAGNNSGAGAGKTGAIRGKLTLFASSLRSLSVSRMTKFPVPETESLGPGDHATH